MLTNFKHSLEEEECPVPDDVRETLKEFHNDLLLHCGEKVFLFFPKLFYAEYLTLNVDSPLVHAGIHIEEEPVEEEVDTSLRGRLLSLLDKIKSIRGKKTEEKPEVEEETKPSKSSRTLKTLSIQVQPLCSNASSQSELIWKRNMI